MENLNLKEQTAIELRFLGNTHSQIARKVQAPEETVRGWFKSDGKLFTPYQEYKEQQDKILSRQREETIKKIALNQEQVFTITTNLARRVAQRLQEEDFKIDKPRDMIRAFVEM